MEIDEASWWRSAVVYQVYPRSFRDARRTGVGELTGLTEGLAHIASLGADAVWISPFFASPGKDFGYDVSDHRAVDPRFGTLADFDALPAEAHRLGLKVLIDLVLSHCSDEHPWFQAACQGRDAPHGGRFVWAEPGEDGGPPNNWLSVFGGPAWTWCAAREQYYLHNFLPSQPDLDFHDPVVRQEALAIARFWLDRGVDGFRLDAINFCFHDRQLRDNPPARAGHEARVTQASNPYSFQQHVFDKNRPEMLGWLEELGSLLASYPGTAALAEIGAEPEVARALGEAYTAPGRLQLSYSFDLLADRFDPEVFREALANAPEIGACWTVSNHDVCRPATRFCPEGEDPDEIARLALALVLGLPGAVCLYQGEELGLPEAELRRDQLVDPYGIAFWPAYKGRDGCRTPMPWRPDGVAAGFSDVESWLPVPEAHRLRAVSVQEVDPDSTLQLARRLVSFRRSERAVREGAVRLGPAHPQVLAFERVVDDDRVGGFFNLSPEPARLELPGAELQPLGGHGGAGQVLDDAVVLPPWSWVWARFG